MTRLLSALLSARPWRWGSRWVYPCACGCDKWFTDHAGWDGYHGPDFARGKQAIR